MRRPVFWILAVLLLAYSGYLLWYFQIEPRRGSQRILWRMQANIWNQGSFQAAPDGSLLLLDYNELRCLEADGSERWRTGGSLNVSVNGGISATPSSFALAPDGGIYLVELSYAAQSSVSGNSKVDLLKLDRQGKEIWRSTVKSQSMLSSSQTVAFSSGVLVLDDTGQCSVFGEDGTALGVLPALGSGASVSMDADQLAVSPAGMIYRIEGGQGVSCYDSGGKEVWSHKDPQSQGPAWLCFSPGNSLLYYANSQDLLALDARDGKVMWRSSFPVAAYNSPRLCIGPLGQVLALNSAGGICHFDDQGTSREITRVKLADLAHFISDGVDRLYVCDSSSGLTALGPDGKQLWTVRQLRSVTTKPQLGPDGRLYVVDNSFLYCLKP